LEDPSAKKSRENFAFRVKLGEYEVSIEGTREQVIKTIEELPKLISNVQKAFEDLIPKAVATLTVKAGTAKDEARFEKYPRVLPTEKCDEVVLRVLETDWGKWRPRTIDELSGALKANGLRFKGPVLAEVLMGLVKRGKVRRWKTDAGHVYILAEKEAIA
jgi:hypothetical protein